MTAVSQIKPKVDDSAMVLHWNRFSIDDSTTEEVALVVSVLVDPPTTTTNP